MTTQAPTTITNGALAHSIQEAKRNDFLRAMAADLVLSGNQDFATNDEHTFMLAVNDAVRRAARQGSFPMLGTAPGAVAALVADYSDDQATQAERKRLTATAEVNALAVAQIAHGGLDYDAVANTSSPAPILVLVQALEGRIGPVHPVAAVLAFRDRVAANVAVMRG